MPSALHPSLAMPAPTEFEEVAFKCYIKDLPVACEHDVKYLMPVIIEIRRCPSSDGGQAIPSYMGPSVFQSGVSAGQSDAIRNILTTHVEGVVTEPQPSSAASSPPVPADAAAAAAAASSPPVPAAAAAACSPPVPAAAASSPPVPISSGPSSLGLLSDRIHVAAAGLRTGETTAEAMGALVQDMKKRAKKGVHEQADAGGGDMTMSQRLHVMRKKLDHGSSIDGEGSSIGGATSDDCRSDRLAELVNPTPADSDELPGGESLATDPSFADEIDATQADRDDLPDGASLAKELGKRIASRLSKARGSGVDMREYGDPVSFGLGMADDPSVPAHNPFQTRGLDIPVRPRPKSSTPLTDLPKPRIVRPPKYTVPNAKLVPRPPPGPPPQFAHVPPPGDNTHGRRARRGFTCC